MSTMSMGTSQYAGIAEGLTGVGMSIGGYFATEKSKEKEQELWEQRVPYTIPGSIEEQVALMRARSQQGLPEEDLIRAQIQQQTAQGITASREAATSAADVLGATTNLYGQQTQALTDLEIASARQRSANQLDYAQALANKAAYEEQEFIYNEAIPWQVKMNQIMNLQQSSMDLVTEGFSTQVASYETFAG